MKKSTPAKPPAATAANSAGLGLGVTGARVNSSQRQRATGGSAASGAATGVKKNTYTANKK